MLTVRYLKQRKTEISLSESRMYKKRQTSAITGRFQTLTWRPGETVQNLESPGLSGRVDSPAVFLKTFDSLFYAVQ